jgi:ParB-like chromosome segregation protein Spo0J
VTEGAVTTDVVRLAGWETKAAHPAAEMLPMMSEEELQGLVDVIQREGFDPRHAIVLHEGRVLDGRNRLAACRELKRRGALESDPPFVEFSGGDPEAFVLRENLHRRHLSREDYRRLIAARLKAAPEKSNRQIAAELNVSPTTVGTVRQELEATVQIGQLERTVGKDGKARAARRQEASAEPRCRILPIDEIRVVRCFRTDMGDLETLAASIESLGLLQPLAIDSRCRLATGHRRLAAVRDYLGWDRVFVCEIGARTEAELLRIQVEDNRLSKAYTSSELAKIGLALENIASKTSPAIRRKRGVGCSWKLNRI